MQALRAGRPVHLSPKQRSILSVFLLYPNVTVSIEHLIECVWDDPPSSAVSNLQSYVTQLRRSVIPDLITRDQGYLLRLEPDQLDLLSFENTVREARRHADAGDLAVANDEYRSALSLWRGRPAEDAALSSSMTSRTGALEELAHTVRAEWSEIRLELGLHAEMIGELRALADSHPLHERVWRQLILALHRSGRRGEALEAYRRVHAVLASELGVEPGSDLQHLHLAILRNDASLASPERKAVRRLVPRQLPPAVGRLVGRHAELDRLEEFSAGGRHAILVVGAAGVGKTTLALHWAHRLADRFPDGQLFLDMRGFDQTPPMTTAEALPRLLQALGQPAEDIPVEVDAQIGLYRSILARRRVLVVLDNVAAPEQLRPLMPGEPGCLLLATSRDRLSGLVALESARRITLEVLDPAEAVDLLADLVGPDRIRREPHAAARLAELCARLPLALRVASARLADRPHQTLAQYVKELSDHGLLSQLEVAGDQRTAVRGAVDRSVETLSPAGRRLFRLIGLVPNSGITVAGAAALSGNPLSEIAKLLDDLARVHLVSAGPNSYSCHDLLVTYAAARSETEDLPGEREAAIRRYMDFYLQTITNAAEHVVDVRLVEPVPAAGPATDVTPLSFGSAADAQSWLDREWDTIAVLIARAAEHGPRSLVWRLADALRDILTWRRPIAECLRIAELGLDAARTDQDGVGQGAMLLSIGYARWRIADLDAALDAYDQAMPFLRRAGFRAGESAVLRASGVVLAQSGASEQAIDRFEQALVIDRDLGNRVAETSSLGNLAALYLDLGRLRDAEERQRQVLAAAGENGQRQLEAVMLTNLGVIQRELGLLDSALATLNKSRSVGREIGSAYAETNALECLGKVHLEAGRYDSARQVLSDTISLARSTENPEVEGRALTCLALANLRLGHLGEVDGHLTAASIIAERVSHLQNHVELWLARSELARVHGRHAEALEHADRARHLAGKGFTLALGKAHSATAAAHLGLGNINPCRDHCEEALRICRQTGQRLSQARTMIILGHIHRRTGNEIEAQSLWRHALAIVTEAGAPEQQDISALLRQVTR
ncbi:BTAD domain-containing putative transcriptional regulator [Nonomuraea sp. NPDC049269]|uniref:AfsR/SARP family transcriptional regulator n=1 Tax=Nonomuraea sp. NPDC049269 TaxID=3364349 RepID=UPI003718FA03